MVKSTDSTVDTILLIGVVGCGKSTLANTLALSNEMHEIPQDPEDQLFNIDSSDRAKKN